MRATRRRLPRVGAILAVSGLTATGLAGCQLFEVHEPVYTPSAIENCVTAHAWVLDTASLTENVALRLAELGSAGDIAIAGGQTLHWNLDGEVVFDTDLQITVTNAGPPVFLLEQTVRGESDGRAVFSGDVAVPHAWSEAQLAVTETMTLDDVAPDPIPWELGRTWIDDTVGLVIECSADTLALEGRGTKYTWTFHQEGWAPPAAPEDESTEAPEAPAS